MNGPLVELVCSPNDAEDLDDLLWRVLWEPLGFARDVRQEFKVEGQAFELVARNNGHIAGGLVAVWTGECEVEVRHLAILPDAQGQGIGALLINHLVEIIGPEGCKRIHAIARNTSVGFFKKMGFCVVPGSPPDHPDFKRHGISFALMEKRLGLKP